MADTARNLNRLAEGLDLERRAQYDRGDQPAPKPEAGVVRKIKEGFGFIAGNDGTDYFFHWTSLQKTSCKFSELEVGDRVEFLKIEAPKGPRAIEVRRCG